MEQVAFTASLELGLINNFPPSPTRHKRLSAHSISMIGGVAGIMFTVSSTVTFLVSFLNQCVCDHIQLIFSVT